MPAAASCPSASAIRVSSVPRSWRCVARLLGADLGGGHGLARPPQPALDIGLLARARAKLVGGRAAALLVGGELGGGGVPAHARRHRVRPQGPRRPLGVVGGPAVAFGALRESVDTGAPLGAGTLGLLGEPALRAQLGHDLGLPYRGGPVAGRLAAALDQPRRAPRDLGGLVALAGGGAHRALRLVALRPGVADGALSRLGGRARGGLVAGGLLGCGHEPLAPVALLEDPLLAARRGLPDLARGGEVGAAGLGRGDAGEVGRQL